MRKKHPKLVILFLLTFSFLNSFSGNLFKNSVFVSTKIAIANYTISSKNDNDGQNNIKTNLHSARTFNFISNTLIENKTTIDFTCPVPVVTSPLYLCQNSAASSLLTSVVPPVAGVSLVWYANATGGTAIAAPTPLTAATGSTTYYVTQTDGVCESARVPIIVNVVATPTGTINLFCDSSQVTATNSVYFDWNNLPGFIRYFYTYTINGGPIVSGNTNLSHLEVFGLTPGQSATLIITSVVGLPCIPDLTLTCTLSCGAAVTNPNFASIPALCAGTIPPVLNTTSPNGINGTWNPSVISNTVSGSYVFTPNPILFPCATIQTLGVSVIPRVTPTFGTITTANGIINSICKNSIAPSLPTSSPNSPAITGTWNPAIINTTTVGTIVYTFTPSSATQCTSAVLTTVSITVIANITPTFAAIAPICNGDVLAPLPTTSTNSIIGTWSPAIDNTITKTYTFTPTAGLCATTTTLTITVNQKVTPTFAALAPICNGDVLAPLPTTSINSITGTWSPTLDNTITKTYTFTPTTGLCSNSNTITITVNQKVTPTFATLTPVCSGTVLSALPTTSLNSITGTWSPALNNLLTTLYTFTPNTGICATNTTLTIEIIPRVTPIFNLIPSVCKNATAPVLPTSSNNTPPITGTWNSTVSTANVGTINYIFTPSSGQCVTNLPIILSVTVIANEIPTFTPIAPICSEETLLPLPTTSTNTVPITGTWSPVLDNTVTKMYTFTPLSSFCATTANLTITVIPKTIPTFNPVATICSGEPLLALPLSSTNAIPITGTWLPVLDNTLTTEYTFTPTVGLCATTQTFTITVNQKISPNFKDISFCSGATAPTLNTLSPNGISGTWLPLIIDNSASATYEFTPNATECAVPEIINVTINEDTLVKIEGVVSNYFLDNQIITVLASDAGEYLYQLDNGPFQESNVFQNTSSGLHKITVIDVNGCSAPISRNDILVISYPKFFTPNNDGFNDRWNIFDLNNQSNSLIFIFDQYGKLLKEISPSGLGWDGNFNGKPLPSSDYWFTIKYSEQSIDKVFKSHFTLKR